MTRVDPQTLALPIRTEVAANFDALVPLQPEPPQILEDGQLRLTRRTLRVGILDAEDERPVVPAREQPVEQGSAGVADVQMAGRRWRESHSHRWRAPLRSRSKANTKVTKDTKSNLVPVSLGDLR